MHCGLVSPPSRNDARLVSPVSLLQGARELMFCGAVPSEIRWQQLDAATLLRRKTGTRTGSGSCRSGIELSSAPASGLGCANGQQSVSERQTRLRGSTTPTAQADLRAGGPPAKTREKSSHTAVGSRTLGFYLGQEHQTGKPVIQLHRFRKSNNF